MNTATSARELLIRFHRLNEGKDGEDAESKGNGNLKRDPVVQEADGKA